MSSAVGDRRTPREVLALFAAHVGEATAAHRCADLITSDDPREHAETLRWLAGPAGEALLAGEPSWQPYWARVWGARGLLYVWDDDVAPAVLAGLKDPHWRVAEMCLKVAARHDLPAGDDAVLLSRHELSRVRAAAARALGAAGDTEHLDAARDLVDDEDAEVRRAAARALEQMECRLDA